MPQSKSLDLREGSDRWTRATNAEQRHLVRVYDEWAAQLKRDLLASDRIAASLAQQTLILEKELPDLEAAMLEASHRGVLTAEKVALRGDDVTPRVLAVRQERLRLNDELITERFVPYIGEQLGKQLAAGVVAKPKLLAAGLAAQRSFPAQMSGNFWTMIFETLKAKGQDENEELRKQGLPPVKVRWLLDPLAEHCEPSTGYYGCPELAGEYPEWDAMPTVPGGQVTCRVNCRCTVEVWHNGQWER